MVINIRFSVGSFNRYRRDQYCPSDLSETVGVVWF